MYIINDYNQLEGKRIAFSHMAEFADQITLVTDDGGILMVEMNNLDGFGEGQIQVYNVAQVKRALEKNRYIRIEIAKRNLFDYDAFAEEMKEKQKQLEEKRKKDREEQERKEWERLNKKFGKE